MVKVELGYNPYLMETVVKFDGREPRINSLVEQYQDSKLQDWIQEIPDIFYNEMNGYGFELEFSGTKMDFEQLKRAFEDAGVLEDQVVLFHKNEIEGREKKVIELKQLVKWITTEESNGVFDGEAFLSDFGEKLNEEYTFIVLNGQNASTRYYDKYKISVEDIESTEELKDASLYNTPIVVFVTRDILPSLQRIVRDLKQRDDINENQIFFIISESLNKDRVERIIRDLGIKRIQTVQSAYDDSIRDYYYAYPVTDHLHDVLRILRSSSNKTNTILKERKQKCEVSNREIHEQISMIDDVVDKLKSSLEKLKNRENIDLPDGCFDAQSKLRKDIEGWRKNKVKFSKEYAEKNANALNGQLQYSFYDFIRGVMKSIGAAKAEYLKYYKYLYEKTQYDDFVVTDDVENKPRFDVPNIIESLLELKDEQYVAPKADLKELIFRDDTLKEFELVVTYYCQEWRQHALDVYIPLSDSIISEQFNQMKAALEEVVSKYIEHIEEAIENEKDKKKEITSKLSSEELELQKGIDWNTTFIERINELERA